MTTKDVWGIYAEDIRRFILSKVKNPVITEDILQETFIKVHTKLHTLKDENKLKPWLFSIARYTILDYFRMNKKEIQVEDLEIESEPEPKEHSEQDCLRGIIKSLPKKYRDPLFLSDIKGLKQSM